MAGWAGANGPAWKGTWAAEKEKKEKGEWAGLENRVRKEKFLQFLKTTQTLQFKFEFKNSNSNRTTSNKTMHCNMNAKQNKQPHLI